MKYKVGDKVRVREDLRFGEYYGQVYCSPEMIPLVGIEAIVTEVGFCRGTIYFKISNNDANWSFTEDMLCMVNELPRDTIDWDYALGNAGGII